MTAKAKMIVSKQPTNHRPSTAERRAAQVAVLATQQAELKQQAADRRNGRGAKAS